MEISRCCGGRKAGDLQVILIELPAPSSPDLGACSPSAFLWTLSPINRDWGTSRRRRASILSPSLFAWSPLQSFMYSHVPWDHMKNFLRFSQGQAFLCSTFLWFYSSHPAHPTPHPLAVQGPELRTTSKASVFFQDKLSSAWVLPLGL